jgi:hypothetical protein
MCALGGNVPAEGFARFALGHCETCKATHATEHRNGEEYLDHVPTSIAEPGAKSRLKPDEFAALRPDYNISRPPQATWWQPGHTRIETKTWPATIDRLAPLALPHPRCR